MKINCSVEILTLNSVATLAKCLESVRDFDDIMVLDGNSTDGTVALAHTFGARVIRQSDSGQENIRISDFSAVRNKGIAAAKYNWFLCIDSDEYLSEEAVEEIRSIVVRDEKNDTFVYRMPRKYVIAGAVIERSSMYPNYQTRFFNRAAVTGFVKPVHEKLRVRDGYRLGTLTHPTYVPFENGAAIIEKWKQYARSQVALSPVPRSDLFWYTFVNVLQSCKYVVKFAYSLLGTGTHMPLLYEWHNFLYHLRLIAHAWRIAYTRS